MNAFQGEDSDESPAQRIGEAWKLMKEAGDRLAAMPVPDRLRVVATEYGFVVVDTGTISTEKDDGRPNPSDPGVGEGVNEAAPGEPEAPGGPH